MSGLTNPPLGGAPQDRPGVRAAAGPNPDERGGVGAEGVLRVLREAETHLASVRAMYESAGGLDQRELERRRALLERAFDALTRQEDRLQDWHDRLDSRARAMDGSSSQRFSGQGEAAGAGRDPGEEARRLARQRDALARELSERDRVIQRLRERAERTDRDVERAARMAVQRERSSALARAELCRRESELLARETLVREAEDDLARRSADLEMRALSLDEHRADLDLLFDELRELEAELDERQSLLERREGAPTHLKGVGDPEFALEGGPDNETAAGAEHRGERHG